MRALLAFVITAMLMLPASASLPVESDFVSLDEVNRWIANYRAKPQPDRLPAAVRTLSRLGALKEADGAGVYVGFIAGVISSTAGVSNSFNRQPTIGCPRSIRGVNILKSGG
jgi:hypothetical protein